MANKKFSDEEIDYMMHKIVDGLQNVFGDSAGIHCIKSSKDDFTAKLIGTYMHYPILKLELTREGCNIQSGMCSVEDVVEQLPHAIGSLLALVPKNTRNNILAKAIQQDMTEDGELLDSINNNDDEEDDE